MHRGAGLRLSEIEKPSGVALLEDLREHGLVRGQVGTVVDIWTPGIYEVEFCDDDGQPYAKLAHRAA